MGNVPQDMTPEDLKVALENIVGKDVVKFTHRGLFCFMTFKNISDGESAIDILNGYKFQGQELTAQPAKQQKDKELLRKYSTLIEFCFVFSFLFVVLSSFQFFFF